MNGLRLTAALSRAGVCRTHPLMHAAVLLLILSGLSVPGAYGDSFFICRECRGIREHRM